jgi:hypothetical protein
VWLGVYYLAASLRDSGMSEITWQTVAAVLDEWGGFLRLASWLDRPARLRADVIASLAWRGATSQHSAYLNFLKAVVTSVGTRSLATDLRRLAPTDLVERSMFLKSLSQQVDGIVVPDFAAAAPAKSRGRQLRAAVQRWVIRTVPADVLARAAPKVSHPERDERR